MVQRERVRRFCKFRLHILRDQRTELRRIHKEKEQAIGGITPEDLIQLMMQDHAFRLELQALKSNFDEIVEETFQGCIQDSNVKELMAGPFSSVQPASDMPGTPPITAQSIGDDEQGSAVLELLLAENNALRTARNEAMAALEQAKVAHANTLKQKDIEIERLRLAKIRHMERVGVLRRQNAQNDRQNAQNDFRQAMEEM